VPEFLHVDWILSQFDSSRDRAVRAYRRFVRQGRGIDIWDELRAGILLGSERFVERMRPLLLDTPLDQNVLRRERDAARAVLEEIFQDVASKSDRDARIHDAVRLYH
jgi:putative transposase